MILKDPTYSSQSILRYHLSCLYLLYYIYLSFFFLSLSPHTVCHDNPSARYCLLVLRFRLCSNDFYHSMCCVTCRARAVYPFLIHERTHESNDTQENSSSYYQDHSVWKCILHMRNAFSRARTDWYGQFLWNEVLILGICSSACQHTLRTINMDFLNWKL